MTGHEDTDSGLYIGSSDRLTLLANPFGTKINTSSNNTIVLVYLCDVPNGLADNFNFSDDPMSVPVSTSSCCSVHTSSLLSKLRKCWASSLLWMPHSEISVRQGNWSVPVSEKVPVLYFFAS